LEAGKTRLAAASKPLNPAARLDLQALVAEGYICYIVWAAETADNVYEVGTDTFLV